MYLTGVNVMVAVISFGKAVVTLQFLTPELLGVVAVIGGVNRTISNLIDVRVADVVSRIYYQTEDYHDEELPLYRSTVLVHGILLNVIIGTALMIISMLVSLVAIQGFTDAPIERWWLVTHAGMQAIALVLSTLLFLQRFVGHFYLFGTARLLIQIVDFVVYGLLIAYIGGIDGYYVANIAGSIIVITLMFVVTIYVWRVIDRLPIGQVRPGSGFRYFWQNRGVLFYGNLLGYSKMLHRAADVLVVGYFADDAITGLYKFARNITDFLLVIYDALNQVYLPQLMDNLAQSAFEQYERTKRLLFKYGMLGLFILMIGEVLFLETAIALMFGEEFVAAAPAILIMTIPVGLNIAVHIGLYTIFLHTGKFGQYTILTSLACGVQYGGLLLAHLLFDMNIVAASVAYVAYYAFQIPMTYIVGRREYHCLTD